MQTGASMTDYSSEDESFSDEDVQARRLQGQQALVERAAMRYKEQLEEQVVEGHREPVKKRYKATRGASNGHSGAVWGR